MDADVPEELQVGHATAGRRSLSVSALMRRKRASAIPESLDVRPCVLLSLSPRSDRHRPAAAPYSRGHRRDAFGRAAQSPRAERSAVHRKSIERWQSDASALCLGQVTSSRRLVVLVVLSHRTPLSCTVSVLLGQSRQLSARTPSRARSSDLDRRTRLVLPFQVPFGFPS